MAKKIRFPLEMENGVEVRSMEELRDNFSISRVLSYLKNGKLEVWLRDRFETDIADKIGKLDLQAEGLAKRLCEVFDIPYNEVAEEELKKSDKREERILLLKEYTDDKQFEEVIDSIAFHQDELYDFLDEDTDTIYLCGEKFSIPLAKEGVSYIGINQPMVVIDSKMEVNWVKTNISVDNVVFDQKYQEVVDKVNKEREKVIKESIIGDYSDKSYINFLLLSEEKKQAKELYQMANRGINDIEFDIADDIKSFQNIAKGNGIIGLMEKYVHFNIKLLKFETMIEDINKEIFEDNYKKSMNIALALIFDYKQCNEYAKKIFEKSNLFFYSPNIWEEEYTDIKLFNDIKTKLEATKSFIQFSRSNYFGDGKYIFIFCALMILVVDKYNVDEYFYTICDFAAMLQVTTKEFENIISIIKWIHKVERLDLNNISDSIMTAFANMLYKTLL